MPNITMSRARYWRKEVGSFLAGLSVAYLYYHRHELEPWHTFWFTLAAIMLVSLLVLAFWFWRHR
jgi:hypothetical protein